MSNQWGICFTSFTIRKRMWFFWHVSGWTWFAITMKTNDTGDVQWRTTPVGSCNCPLWVLHCIYMSSRSFDTIGDVLYGIGPTEEKWKWLRTSVACHLFGGTECGWKASGACCKLHWALKKKRFAAVIGQSLKHVSWLMEDTFPNDRLCPQVQPHTENFHFSFQILSWLQVSAIKPFLWPVNWMFISRRKCYSKPINLCSSPEESSESLTIYFGNC